MLKAVILDNENLTRQGTSALVKQTHMLDVVAELETSDQLFTLLRKEVVNVIVMEWRLKAMDGLESISRLMKMYPQVRVVIFSSHLSGTFPQHIWQLGVTGMVSREDSFEEFKKVLKNALNGQRLPSAEVSRSMVQKLYVDHEASPFDTLTHREMQVLMMVVGGMRIQEIADQLCISSKTVNTYRYRLFEKLGVRGEVEMTKLALRCGIVEDAPFVSFDQMMPKTHSASSLNTVH